MRLALARLVEVPGKDGDAHVHSHPVVLLRNTGFVDVWHSASYSNRAYHRMLQISFCQLKLTRRLELQAVLREFGAVADCLVDERIRRGRRGRRGGIVYWLILRLLIFSETARQIGVGPLQSILAANE